jgi:antitoxin component YwqK of YwqJK toxin-antitoxin module
MSFATRNTKPLFACLMALALLVACRGKTHEVITEFHENGNPKTIQILDESGAIVELRTFHFNKIRESYLEFEDGKPHGELHRWGTNGVLQETAEFEKGKRHGITETWYEDRLLLSRATYENGKLQGERIQWFANGDNQWQEFWKAGIPSGTWTEWFASGQMKWVNSCHADVPQGMQIEYSPQGMMLRTEECQSGIRQGRYLENYESGQAKVQGNFRNGKSHGHWTFFRADGKKWIELDMENGLRHGLLRRFDPQENLLAEFPFVQGSGSVAIRCPPPDSNLFCAESTWVAGYLDGPTRVLDLEKWIQTERIWKAGSLESEQSARIDRSGNSLQTLLAGGYEKNKRSGIWRTWFDNGTLKESLNYQGGELWGTQRYFDSTGHLYLEKRHQGIRGQVIIDKLDPRPFPGTKK